MSLTDLPFLGAFRPSLTPAVQPRELATAPAAAEVPTSSASELGPDALETQTARLLAHPELAGHVEPFLAKLRAGETTPEHVANAFRFLADGFGPESSRGTASSAPRATFAPPAEGPLFEGTARERLMRALGPSSQPLVESYEKLGEMARGKVKPTVAFMKSLRTHMVALESDSGIAPHKLLTADQRHREMLDVLAQMHGNGTDVSRWQQVHALAEQNLVELAADKGLYLTSTEPGTWAPLRAMRPDEARLEKERRENPAAAAITHRLGAAKQALAPDAAEREAALKAALVEKGLKPQRKWVQGPGMTWVGKDAQGELHLLDDEGGLAPLQAHQDRAQMELLAQKNPELHATLSEQGLTWREAKAKLQTQLIQDRIAVLNEELATGEELGPHAPPDALEAAAAFDDATPTDDATTTAAVDPLYGATETPPQDNVPARGFGAAVRRSKEALLSKLQAALARWPKLNNKRKEELLRDAGAQRKKVVDRLVYLAPRNGTGETVVHDFDGQKLGVEAYRRKRATFHAINESIRLQDGLDEQALKGVDRLSDEELEHLEGPTVFRALTDDRARDNTQTRTLATRLLGDKIVVAFGRFKGYLLESLIHAAGRRQERGATALNPRTGATVRIKSDPAAHEPYITVVQRKVNGVKRDVLRAQLPGGRGDSTLARQRMKALMKQVPTAIVQEAGGLHPVYTFPPQFNSAVLEALGGGLYSHGAARVMNEHHEQLARVKQAVQPDRLSYWTPENIGGFRTTLKDRAGNSVPLSFRQDQQKQLAFLHENGYRGIVPLAMGRGKTLVAIAAMQRLLNAGLLGAEGEKHSRFLVVVPQGLRGNFRKEISRFLDADSARALGKRLDLMTYGEMRAAAKSGTRKGKPFSFDAYGMAVLDEPDRYITDPSTQVTRTALAMDVPRTVLLTGTPGQRFESDLPVLDAAATRSIDMQDRGERRDFLTELRKGRERYASPEFGGKLTQGRRNLSEEELAKLEAVVQAERDYKVNSIMVVEDPKNDPEYNVPETLHGRRLVPLAESDDPVGQAVIAKYREIAKGYRPATRSLAARFLHLPNPAARRAEPGISADERRIMDGKNNEVLRTLRALSNRPGDFVEGAGYPKLRRAAADVNEILAEDPYARVGLWSWDREMALASAKYLSRENPEGVAEGSEAADAARGVANRLHVAALNDGIHVFRNGEELGELDGIALPLKKKAYAADGQQYAPGEWQQYAVDHLFSRPDVATVSLNSDTYGTGFNLQHVISDELRYDEVPIAARELQLEARRARDGQTKVGKSYLYTSCFPDPTDALDITLDQANALVGVRDAENFRRNFYGAGAQDTSGDWLEMERHSVAEQQREAELVDLLLSPDFERVAQAEHVAL